MKTPLHTWIRPKAIWPFLIFVFVALHSYLEAAPSLANATSTTKTMATNGIAVWYRVPADSLAHRRAKPTEFTAAHNHLPIGTLVRVTRVSNCRDVVVRITDRGITNRHATIDLCKEAAERLGMLREGVVRVSLEVITEAEAGNASGPNEVAAQ